MKITLICGTHITASRERFQKILDGIHKREWEVVHLTSNSSITESLRGTSLFEQNKVFVCEDLKILDEKTLKFLEKKVKDLDSNLLLYSKNAVPVKLNNFVKKYGKIEVFDLPKTIFTFLDSLYPGNSRNSIKLFLEVLKTEPVEFVFSLIAGLYRDLYWAKNDPDSMSTSPWRIGKLKNQASRYSNTILIYIITVLADLDIKVKTSQADLSQSLDLFIIKELK
ncbi:MAG: hypothetical protein US96_C0001G0002 [Candidatus Woesebacteria bacterium GW2011_GWB1_38_5b]|uniref:DNA polymerase III delta N-terminal domain-containing protein n=1 Tax=Candidatus Woesebacteria bacterium GW2011_GWB1_38_5b TaxID=1618569 RepID=A0A0G0NFN3_9BACT|nr:MAG: hypothetical protein US96_C0001G0002 [Candidatus Woesebacteria bacterium GW2011_GWB1_38_5b]